MDYFLKTYTEICKKEFAPYGFKKKGSNNFVRVTNDVMQNFHLNRNRFGYSCTVEFGIIPLCYRIEKDQVTGGLGANHLKMFEGSVEWWDYDQKSNESMECCIMEIVNYMKEYLIPFFEKGINCTKAYHEICAFEIMFYNEVFMEDYWKYCMSLKAGDIDQALKHLKAVEQQKLDAYKINMKAFQSTGGASEGYEEGVKEEIGKIQKEIECIANRDEEFIQAFIHDNEAYSLNNLKGLV